MTLHTLLIILLWAFSIVFLFGLILITFLIGRSTIKDNPDKALIYVRNGLHVDKPIKAIRKGKSNRGVSYKYGKNTVFVPSTYAEVYHHNRRMVFLNKIGQVIALPFSVDVTLNSDEKSDLIYELIESHIGADSIRALKGKSNLSIIMVALIAFAIGAIAVYGILQFQSTMNQKAPVTPTPASAAPISGEPVIIK